MNIKNKNKIAFILSEAVVSISIIAGFVIVLLGVNAFYLNMAFGNKQPLKASLLLEEGVEVLKFLRDDSWSQNISSLNNNTPYYLTLNNNEWSLIDTLVQNDIYTRSFVFEEVYRNSNGDIDENGNLLDVDTKLANINVSWTNKNGLNNRNIEIYISNIFQN